VSVHLRRRPPLPHPTQLRPSAPMHLPRPQRIPVPSRSKRRSPPRDLLLRPLSLRLRLKLRIGPPLLRRGPRPNQTQNRLHLSLPGPNPPPSIHLSQHEYINAFGTDSWRQTIRASFDRPTPPVPQAHLDSEYEPNADTISESEPSSVADSVNRQLPTNAASYLESALAKLHQNK